PFPPGFTWGAATAAHQVEGGNWNNDWWAWEHAPGTPCKESSGDACDQYHRWAEDLDLLASFGFAAYRFSLEWSRIEPEDGEFSRAELEHYRRLCAGCRERGLEPIVTFHHFTTPHWLAARHLRDVVGRVCTINEPNIVADMGYRWGVFPPGHRDPALRLRANEVLR